jgi:hypothetical protein
MLKAIVLICAIGTQPYDCGEDRARDVIRTPVETALPFACIREGQLYFAGIDYPLRGDEYPRVVCVRPALPGNVG